MSNQSLLWKRGTDIFVGSRGLDEVVVIFLFLVSISACACLMSILHYRANSDSNELCAGCAQLRLADGMNIEGQFRQAEEDNGLSWVLNANVGKLFFTLLHYFILYYNL